MRYHLHSYPLSCTTGRGKPSDYHSNYRFWRYQLHVPPKRFALLILKAASDIMAIVVFRLAYSLLRSPTRKYDSTNIIKHLSFVNHPHTQEGDHNRDGHSHIGRWLWISVNFVDTSSPIPYIISYTMVMFLAADMANQPIQRDLAATPHNRTSHKRRYNMGNRPTLPCRPCGSSCIWDMKTKYHHFSNWSAVRYSQYAILNSTSPAKHTTGAMAVKCTATGQAAMAKPWGYYLQYCLHQQHTIS